MNRPNFPEVLDSTTMAAFKSCPRKAELECFHHWKPRNQSIHLHAGAAYASGIEAARVAYYVDGKSPEASLAAGLWKLLHAYGDFECPADSAKSAQRMAGALEYYFDQYPLGVDKAVPMTLPGNARGIEFNFLEPLDIIHPVTGNPILYSGRMDMMCDFEGLKLGEDDKTASQLGATWPAQWDLRSQFTGYCLTGDTEVLTPEGWVSLDTLQQGVPVAQWAAGALDFAVPTEYHSPDYTGPLYKVAGKVSFNATPEHRTVVYDTYTDTYKTQQLQALKKNSGSLRYISAGWKTDGETFSDSILRLLVAIQADGSWTYAVDGSLLHVRFGFTKERKAERLLQLLNEAGLEWHSWNDKSRFAGKVNTTELLVALESLLGPKKLWGSWLLRFSGKALQVIMEELRFWDGTLEDTLYSTSIPENADWIKTIAALCGIRASIHTQAVGDKLQYRVSYTTTHLHSVHLHQHAVVDFSGKVYCLTVPSSHFLIRHAGKISVTGNCWGAQQAGIKLDGFLIRGVSILKTKYETMQAITYRPQWMIDRWYEQLLRDIRRMLVSWESGYFDYALDHACVEYGGCPFKRVCQHRDPAALLEMQFEQRRWDPVARTETLL